MSDDKKRIIDYDAFNELPPNSWLVVDSEGQGTGKIAPIKIGATYEIQDGAHSFTLVGSNGYSHTVDIPYDSVQMSYDDYDALTEIQKMDGTNRFVPDCPTSELEPEIWQRVGRDPLTTDEKTVSKAINELDAKVKALTDVFYPIGSYYETTDTTFDPNVSWSGTWVLEDEGLVHISSGTNYAVSNLSTDGGEATHTLSVAEMPSHAHGIAWYKNKGTASSGGAYSINCVAQWWDVASTAAGNTGPIYSTPNGSGDPHNNMQPYKIVNRWHRTA